MIKEKKGSLDFIKDLKELSQKRLGSFFDGVTKEKDWLTYSKLSVLLNVMMLGTAV